MRPVKIKVMANIIGRTNEISLLKEYVESPRSEFIAVYGRRRVGKTFLIDQLFQSDYTFSLTGVVDGDAADQMQALSDAFDMYGFHLEQRPQTWMEAFSLIRKAVSDRLSDDKKCIIFIDELPSLDVRGMKLVDALGYFWNSWASKRNDVKLIVCGSATSWMMRTIIDSKGGLHDRITHELHLHPFNLKETECFLQSMGINWDRMSILQTYMVFGGIPYYLGLLRPQLSLPQNIDNLFFYPNAEMKREFKRLYKTLFRLPEPYMEIIRILAEKRSGFSRDEIARKLGKTDNGHLSEKLEDLVNCDIIRLYNIKHKKISSRNGIYQLMDFYTLFYLTFIEKHSADEHYWTHHLNTPEMNTWLGLAFERVCLAHIPQIKEQLHIDSMATEYYSWRSVADESHPQGAQIDLLIERADRVINLCEIKYCEDEYLITKDDDTKMRNRISLFRYDTGTKSAIWPTYITTFGLSRGSYSTSIQWQITMDDLFK